MLIKEIRNKKLKMYGWEIRYARFAQHTKPVLSKMSNYKVLQIYYII